MPSGSMAIVVGASAEEFDHVKQCLSDWQCVAAPLNDEETEVSSIPAAAERRLKKFIFAFHIIHFPKGQSCFIVKANSDAWHFAKLWKVN